MDMRHDAEVQGLQKQIARYYAARRPFRVYHGSTNSTRVLTFKRSEMVDVSRLNRVLKVDPVKKVALVEPNVPMDKLVNATLKYDLVPPVVTEFPGITVGGAIQGAAAETSSFRWGCFSQTVNFIEMILGNGELVMASPQEWTDLFYGTAGSYGSLGLVTAAEIQLIPAKRYVQVTHHHVTSRRQGVELMSRFASEGNCDFIEWVMFRPDHGAVVIGKLVDRPVGKIRRFRWPWNQWYYRYVKSVADSGEAIQDSLPLKDYLFRFNRGAFWAADLAFEQSGRRLNKLTQVLLDPWLRTRKLYQALQISAAGQEYICQDIVLPAETTLEFLEFIDREFELYPIGGCPMKAEPRSPLQCNGILAELLFNIGVYGLRVRPYEKFVAANRVIEDKTRLLGGKKWFYAHSYYSEKEFWKLYDKQWYDGLRRKYHADTLPDIYERIRVREQHSVRKRKAILRVMLGQSGIQVID